MENIKIHLKTALEYQEKYAEVFIDEYQDSNLVQEILLSAVAKENNMIYGWRCKAKYL